MLIEFTHNRVKTNTKLTNFMKVSRIKKYSGEQGLILERIMVISDDLLKFDQIIL